jgi:hypothetical protein
MNIIQLCSSVTSFALVFNLTDITFNLQVVLGIAYRSYSAVCESFNIKNKECWTINRGKDLSPVKSCEGMFL